MTQQAALILSREQARRVDQIAIENFGVPGIVLMENASRSAADIIRQSDLPWQQAVILCGGGNNGGDGLAIARHLANAGGQIVIGLCTDPARYTGDAAVNWNIVQRMKLPMMPCDDRFICTHLTPGGAGIIIDAIFGTGLASPPRPPFERWANAVAEAVRPVVAIDVPSGLDCDTGMPLGVIAIRANLTITFVGAKKGFLHPSAAAYTGPVKIADIGCPAAAVAQAIDMPRFVNTATR
jgi:NAD(P)H-hydrate epimerase